ncbi:MAG: ABC transporter substrate-binding protein [Jatrophihabitantaceae bacterium]
MKQNLIGRRSAIALLSTVVLAAGCTSGGSDSTSTKSTANLTMILTSPPTSLNPGLMNVDPNNLAYEQLGYAPLIRVGPDGTYSPALASSFGYVGTGNTQFQLQLRPGLKFADGSPLTAASVAASISYALKAGGSAAAWLGSCGSITATSADRVMISCTSPNPTLPLLLSQNAPFGFVISPAGLAKPDSLKTATFGAGPYLLDGKQTVAGDHYVYLPNPNYFDQKAIHHQKVTLKVVANPSAVLSSIRAGQADLAIGDPSTADAAKAAGLAVYSAPSYTTGVDLFDRAGTLAKPLADPRVRQALNYALDRAAITKALFGSYGTATTQLMTPVYDGYDPALNSEYGYDPAKAKQLLADAGYPNGFSMQIEAWQGFNIAQVTQAIMGYWAKIGVKAVLTSDAAPASWVSNVLAKKFPAAGYGYAGLPVFQTAQNWFRPSANPFNPFSSADPQLTALLDQAAAAAPEQASALSIQAMRYALLQGWFVTTSLVDAAYYTRKGLTGVTVTPRNIFTDLTQITPN